MTPQDSTTIEPHTSGESYSDSSGVGYECQLNDNPGQLLELTLQSKTRKEAAARVAQQLCKSIDCTALWYFQRNQENHLSGPEPLLFEGSQSLWPVVGQWLIEKLSGAASNKPIALSNPQVPGSRFLLVPVFFQTQQPDLLCCIVNNRVENMTRAEAATTMIASYLAVWERHQLLTGMQLQQETMSLVLGMSQAVCNSSNSKAALMQLANYLRKVFGGSHAAVVSTQKDGSQPTIAAVSDVESFDESNQVVKAAEAACSLAVENDSIVVWSNNQKSDSPTNLLFLQYSQAMGVEGCLNAKLQAQATANQPSQILGAVLIGGDVESVCTPAKQELASRLMPYVASVLATTMRAQQNPLQQIVQRGFEKLRRRWVRIALAAMLVGAAVLMIPLPYKIKCDCEIQPVIRRFVSAPYDGRLEKTLVKRGDLVEADDVLARMDGRSLRMELSSLQAQLGSENKRQQSALAQGNVAESQIAGLEANRLESEIKLIQSQLNKLLVRSPITGVVVSGDLEKVEGATMELGQEMFEVAPLDSMLVQVAIPESEIKYAKIGMPVKILLNAYPYDSWHGTIRTIRPRTEIKQNDSVFIAEVELENPNRQLRPGMRGNAKVRSTYSPLGWNLFHNAWEKARLWLVW